MASSPEPIFFDLDPHTGQPIPTTYDAMQKRLLSEHPPSVALPADIGGLLRTAIDYVALPYEQANAGRSHLYERLTNDAFLKTSLAIELSLRHCLGRGNGVPLLELIDQGLTSGLVSASNADAWVWTELRVNRTALAHGNPSANSYGPSTSRLIECVIDAVNALYHRGNE